MSSFRAAIRYAMSEALGKQQPPEVSKWQSRAAFTGLGEEALRGFCYREGLYISRGVGVRLIQLLLNPCMVVPTSSVALYVQSNF